MSGAHAAPQPFWQLALGTATRRTLRSALVFAVFACTLIALRPIVESHSFAVKPVVESELEHLTRVHQCTTTSLPPGVEPTRAIIRDTSAELRVVSFAEGWHMYLGEQPGTLVAVCRS
jgi:hypothetical protein